MTHGFESSPGSDDSAQAITVLLSRVAEGDQSAADQLMTQLYPDLKRMAARVFRSERPNHTLQPTALVNEAYMRTFGARSIDWRSRAHFFAVMATQIRRVLVDHARGRRAEKRGGGGFSVSLDETDGEYSAPVADYFALDEALTQLAQEDARAARVVELRFFGGLKDSEIAEVLEISMPTVTRDWRFARAWLASRLE